MFENYLKKLEVLGCEIKLLENRIKGCKNKQDILQVVDKCFEKMNEIHDGMVGSRAKKEEEAERLTQEILETILALSSLDFSKNLDVGFEDSGFNAVAAGLNMLGEELERSVVGVEYVNSIFESMNDSLIVVNPNGTIKTINSFCSSLLGYSKDDNLGNLYFKDLVKKESFELLENRINGLEHSPLRALDMILRNKHGEEIPMQMNISCLVDKSGNSTGLLLVGRDMRVTLALISKAELAAKAERRRAHELSLAHVELEKAHEHLRGSNKQLHSEVEHRKIAEEQLKDARDRLEQKVLERTKELRRSNTSLNIEIEERKKAESEVRAREEKFRNIFETAAVGIIEVDLTQLATKFNALSVGPEFDFYKELQQDEGLRAEFFDAVQILDVNQAILSMFGAESKNEFSLRLKEIFTPKNKEWVEAGWQALEQQKNYFETSSILHTLDKKELDILGQVRVFPKNTEKLPGLVTIIDLSETKSLREQLRQSQKMEAVGRVAGGIAHDFNNLLTVILSYGQMVLDDLDDKSDLRAKISPMVECSERAATLTRQLLAFSRKQVIEPKIIELNKLINNMAKMLNRILGEDVELINIAAPDLAPIKVDPGQVEQIIMNLAVNARDAMESGGRLTVETKNIILDANYAGKKSDVEPGKYIMLAVTDSGSGMSKEVQARIFEPFYTTKGIGKGTGLGLSTVYGIVKQSNGHVEVYSELGHGTVFKIYFPQCVTNLNKDTEDTKLAQKKLGGSGTILVVEDEDSVRLVACAILRKYGYQVIDSGDPLQAIELYKKQTCKIDLLLSDVIMPNIKGPEMVAKIRKLNPEQKVLFMSGYTDNAINQNGILDNGKEFLQKPFTPQDLLRKVGEIISKTHDQ